ncbi:MAG: HAD family hydrolase [Chloroflexi bacterium]|nr:HAD family hydrolase [Chloroflexota bacterium]
MSGIHTLLIDADDTLWENNIYYERCSQALVEQLAPLGIAADDVMRAIRRHKLEVIPDYGYGPRGYIEALGRSALQLAQEKGLAIGPDFLERSRSCGAMMLHPPLELLPGVRESLRTLAASYRLVLVTKGDNELQRRKLERSGLAEHFEGVYVLEEKDLAAYQRVAADLGTDPGSICMVGNSPKSDINPAIEAGMWAVLIEHPHTWEAEQEAVVISPRMFRCNSFGELPDCLRSMAQFST